MGSDIFVIGNTNVLVYIIVILFGIGSWVAINGLWVELPVIVPHLPEGWSLLSYLSVIIQLANIGPILVTIIHVCAPGKLKDKPVVYAIVVIGMASCLLLAFFWDSTSYIAGATRSTALLILQFFLALVDCTTSVVFLPFMSVLKPQYMTAYFIGEGLSGLIPSVVALGQGAGAVSCVNASHVNKTTNETTYKIDTVFHDPKIPIEDFFFFLFAMMIISGVAFTLLNYTPYCKKEYAVQERYTSRDASPANSNMSSDYELREDNINNISRFVNPVETGNSTSQLLKRNSNQDKLKINTNYDSVDIEYVGGAGGMSKSVYVYFLILTAWVNALSNGVLPSIQTYACLPYGLEAYHLAATLGNIANPLACFITFFITVTSATVISIVSFIGTAIAGYILFISAKSPTPVLHGTVAGEVIVIAAWVLVVLLLTFTKVSIAGLFRTEGKRALLWIGGMTQLGSFIGAVTTYLLVNSFKLFTSAAYCPS